MDVKSKKLVSNKPHLNVAFIGGFSSGKSTIAGQLVYLSERLETKKFEKI